MDLVKEKTEGNKMKRFLVLVTISIIALVSVAFVAKSVLQTQDTKMSVAKGTEAAAPYYPWMDQGAIGAGMDAALGVSSVNKAYPSDDPDALINALYANPTALRDAIGAGLDAAFGPAR